VDLVAPLDIIHLLHLLAQPAPEYQGKVIPAARIAIARLKPGVVEVPGQLENREVLLRFRLDHLVPLVVQAQPHHLLRVNILQVVVEQVLTITRMTAKDI
jgi:hypothetical protein